MPKIVPKSIQTCFGRVLGQTFEKFCPVFHGRSSLRKFSKNQKICKIPKMPKIVPKSIQTCFELVLGQIFRKIFAQFSMECRVFENFQKKLFKIPKMPKIVPKSIQTCFELVLGQIFRKIFLPSVPRRVEFSKNFLQIKKLSKFKNAQNRSQRSPNMFSTCFGANFSKNFCPVFHGMSSVRKFSKKNFQNSKNAQKCSQKYPNVF